MQRRRLLRRPDERGAQSPPLVVGSDRQRAEHQHLDQRTPGVDPRPAEHHVPDQPAALLMRGEEGNPRIVPSYDRIAVDAAGASAIEVEALGTTVAVAVLVVETTPNLAFHYPPEADGYRRMESKHPEWAIYRRDASPGYQWMMPKARIVKGKGHRARMREMVRLTGIRME